MLEKYFLCLFVFVLISISGYKADDEAEDAKPAKAAKKTSKAKGPKVNVDTKDLEGEWDTSLFYNYTQSKIVARKCSDQPGVKWSIKGSQWTQNLDNTADKKDLSFNSNGRWSIMEVVKQDDINYVKMEVMKDSIELIQACVAYMRDNDKLYTMLNFTKPESCPKKFVFFDGVCSNTIQYTVSTCTGGKCAKKEDAEKDSSALKIPFSGLVALSALTSVNALTF